jgi:hypothetical protein
VFLIARSEVFVFRLSWLGRFFIGGILGLMKAADGEAGSDTRLLGIGAAYGGWIERPFIFRGRRGDGEVMGRSEFDESFTDKDDIVDGNCEGGCCSGSCSGRCSGSSWGGNCDNCPKLVAGYDARGIKLTGESGEEDGDGSDRGEESVVERVVVGDESADSDVWVDVLSWCLCVGSEGTALARR